MEIPVDTLKILMLEDSPSDAKLIQRAIAKNGIKFNPKVIESKAGFVSTLKEFKPDVILSDHSLAGFDSKEALILAKEFAPDVPFILVTGTVSEEYAVS